MPKNAIKGPLNQNLHSRANRVVGILIWSHLLHVLIVVKLHNLKIFKIGILAKDSNVLLENQTIHPSRHKWPVKSTVKLKM